MAKKKGYRAKKAFLHTNSHTMEKSNEIYIKRISGNFKSPEENLCNKNTSTYKDVLHLPEQTEWSRTQHTHSYCFYCKHNIWTHTLCC